MKLKKFAKLAVATSLVAGLVSAGGVQSLAASGVTIDASGPEESQTIEDIGDIEDDEIGLALYLEEGAEVTVGAGDITIDQDDNYRAYGINVNAEDDSSATVTTGDISVNGNMNGPGSADISGVSAYADSGSDIDITVEGAVNTVMPADGTGIIQAGGVRTYVEGESTSEITIRDGVSVSAPGAVYGATAVAEGEDALATITVENGGISTDNSSLSLDDLREMLTAELREEYGEDAPEDMIAYYVDMYIGMLAMNVGAAAVSGGCATAEVNVTGDVAAVGGVSDYDSMIRVEEDITPAPYNTTALMASYTQSMEFFRPGNDQPEGSASITVNGNVSSDGDGISAATWIYYPMVRLAAVRSGAPLSGALANGEAEDGAVQNGDSPAYFAQLSDLPVIAISVDGNVTAAGRGLIFVSEQGQFLSYQNEHPVTVPDIEPMERSEEERTVIMPRADIVINGELSGERGSVIIGEDSGDYLDLTVWKVALDEYGNAVMELITDEGPYGPIGPEPMMRAAAAPGEDDESPYSYEHTDAAEALERRIMYIIRLEQPTEGGTLAAQKEDGSALDTSHDYEIAREGDKVILAVNVQDGYHLVNAYNGEEKVQVLGQDGDGNYYIEVPRGGGVYLSVVLERDEEPVPEPEPEPEPDPEPDVDPIIPDDTNVVVSSVTRVPTGDSTHFGMWIGLMAASAVCLGGAVIFKKKSSEMNA